MSSRSLGHAARARMIIPAPAAQPCGKARKGLVRNLQSIDFYIPMTHCQNSQQEGTRLSHAPLDKHVDKFGLVQYGRGKPLICRAAPQIACFSCTRRGRKRHDSRLSMRQVLRTYAGAGGNQCCGCPCTETPEIGHFLGQSRLFSTRIAQTRGNAVNG